MELPDKTLVTHSHLMGDGDEKTVKVHFERPVDYGFDSVTYMLPYYTQIEKIGNYTDEEITKLERFTVRNAHLFYQYAEEGGHGIA